MMIGGGRTPNAIALREPLPEMGLPWIGLISAGTTVIDIRMARTNGCSASR